MASKRAKTVLSDEDQERAGDLARAVKGAKTLEDLAGALSALGRAEPAVSKAAAERLDFTRLPKFGGAPVEEEGAISWDASAVLYVGEGGFSDLDTKLRPDVAAPESPPANEAAGEAESEPTPEPAVRDAKTPMQAPEGEPTQEAFAEAVQANAEELNVAITGVRVRLSSQDVTIELTIPHEGKTKSQDIRKPRGRWAGQWRQIAAELVAQVAEGAG